MIRAGWLTCSAKGAWEASALPCRLAHLAVVNRSLVAGVEQAGQHCVLISEEHALCQRVSVTPDRLGTMGADSVAPASWSAKWWPTGGLGYLRQAVHARW